jgi:hypothetical protein
MPLCRCLVIFDESQSCNAVLKAIYMTFLYHNIIMVHLFHLSLVHARLLSLPHPLARSRSHVISRQFMHLTNYAINKHNDEFEQVHLSLYIYMYIYIYYDQLRDQQAQTRV